MDGTHSRKISASQRDLDILAAIQSGNESQTRNVLGKYGSALDEFIHPLGFRESPYVTAIRLRQFSIIPILIEHKINMNINLRGRSPIVEASKANSTEIVSLLLRNGADPNSVDRSRLCALYWAVKHNNSEVLKLLIAKGADVNLQIRKQSTILHSAAADGKLDMVKELVKHKACVNSLDDFGNTPIFSSVGVNDYEMTSLLLEKGSAVNVINVDYRTPLHMAAASVHQSLDITRLLLQNGALVNAPDCYGNIPLVLSLRNSVLLANITTAEVLIRHGSELNTDKARDALEWTTMAHCNSKLMKLAIEAGFRVRGTPWVTQFIAEWPGPSNWYTINNSTQNKDFLDFLRFYQNNPMSLSEDCRIAIREHLIKVSGGASIHYRIEQLPLPKPLTPFMQLEM